MVNAKGAEGSVDSSQPLQEISAGDRFAFGENWSRFLGVLDENRVRQAEQSLCELLQISSLAGIRFLDVGSGSGLFSLAARRLGAHVHSFDYDQQSVACTLELRHRYFDNDPDWTVDHASVLDPVYLEGLGQFDVVYSWGVLHHTGEMWRALENIVPLIGPTGRLLLAIYNDQGGASHRWRRFKQFYNTLPVRLRPLYALLIMFPREMLFFIVQLVRGTPMNYVRQVRNYAEFSQRGMSYWHDLIDWIGGYPFEVAKPEQVFDFLRDRGFELRRLSTCAGGIGCNEYVFERRVTQLGR